MTERDVNIYSSHYRALLSLTGKKEASTPPFSIII